MEINRFVEDHLSNYRWATKDEAKQGWDVEGILKKRSNEILKFDLKPLYEYKQGVGKKGSTGSKADKMVFETNISWIIIDMQELKKYVIKEKLSIVDFNYVLNNLDWNIEIKK
jgi:hypothetical protein